MREVICYKSIAGEKMEDLREDIEARDVELRKMRIYTGEAK